MLHNSREVLLAYSPSVPHLSRYSKQFRQELKQGTPPTPSASPEASTPPSSSPASAATGRRQFVHRRSATTESGQSRSHGDGPSAPAHPPQFASPPHATETISSSSATARPPLEGVNSGAAAIKEEEEEEELHRDLAALRQFEAAEASKASPVAAPKSSGAAAAALETDRSAHPPYTGPAETRTSRARAADGTATSTTPSPPLPVASDAQQQQQVSTNTTFHASSRPSSSPSSSSSAPPRPIRYACDMCPHLRFFSFEDAEAHLLASHADYLPDYERLRNVVRQLQSPEVWEEVRKQKTSMFLRCGQRVLEEGRRKDPGPSRMLEAHRAREQLEAVVQQWHPTAKVFIFGSSVTFGVWDGAGDVDFTVVDEAQLRAGTWPPPERNAVRSITELLRRAGFSYVNLEPISHARVPIIKHHASYPLRVDPAAVRRELLAGGRSRPAPAATPQEPLEEGEVAPPMPERAAAPTGIPLDEDTRAAAAELETSLDRRLEAEDVISRSVRYILNGPASWEDRLLLEASIREAVGPAAVQQIWWNRTRDLLNVTLDSTTNAIRAATCPLAVVSPSLRARIQPLHDDCRPELYGIDFDLSFRVFGIRNSQLLRRYLMQHPCARPGATVLKEWSKRSGVNNSVNGFLTSYAVAILWLYFLLQKGVVQFVDPVKDVPASLEGCPKNPQYVPMVDETWTPAQQTQYATQTGELLVEFFYFYAVEFDWQRHVVSLNRPGITTKEQLGWIEDHDFQHASGGTSSTSTSTVVESAATPSGSMTASITGPAAVVSPAFRRHSVRYSFCIEDPYEENLNLGRHMGITKTLRVQAEFYRGLLSLLKDGARDVCVFPPAAAGTDEEGDECDPSTGAPAAAEPTAHVPPVSLAHRVLYKLMAIALREMVKSKREFQQKCAAGVPAAAPPSEPQQEIEATTPGDAAAAAAAAASQSPTASSSAPSWPGLSQVLLRTAMERYARTELKIALKVWNWQQLVHRLGFKIHHAHVFPRRDVGVRRLAGGTAATAVVPAGVIPTNHAREMMKLGTSDQPAEKMGGSASASSPSSSAGAVPSTAAVLRQLPARGLSAEMQAHLSKGYMQLTPEWVAWSEPWAASTLATAPSTTEAEHDTAVQDTDTGAGGGGGGGGGLSAPLHWSPKLLLPRTRRTLQSPAVVTSGRLGAWASSRIQAAPSRSCTGGLQGTAVRRAAVRFPFAQAVARCVRRWWK